MSAKIISPKTQRKILVGGKAYEDLVKSPKYRKETLKRAQELKGKGRAKPRKKLPVYENVSLKEEYEKVPETRRYKRRILGKQLPRAYQGRGSPTRGWRAVAPQRGRERHELHQKCGGSCFLDPIEEKFPICPALRYTNGQCQIDRRGIQAAYNRARQYGHDNIADKARKLKQKYSP